MNPETLTKSEREIMNLLWHTETPLTAAEILELCTERTWRDSYIHLLIRSLLKKDVIRAAGIAKTTRNYARTFAAAISEEEYAVRQILNHIKLENELIVTIVSALVDQVPDKPQLIDQLESALALKKVSFDI